MAIKILFFIETLSGGGAEKVLCNLVNAMDQSQFDITVQTLWKTDPKPYLHSGIRYRWCFASKSRINIYRSRLEAASGLTYPLHIKGDYNIEAAYLEFGSTKILSRSTNQKAKKIAWVHSDLARKLNGHPETQRKLEKQYKAFDRIVCVSETTRDSFVRLFGRQSDTVVLYNTMNDTAIRDGAELPAPPLKENADLILLAVGRLAPEKRYDMLLRVHQRLLEEGLPHQLWIVGEGPQRGKLEATITENGLQDSVRLFGFQSNPYPFMKLADLLVCSSSYEGLSTFVAEGLILGKAIVTTDCSGMRELLGDSEYGLITENSEAALLSGIRQLLTDPALRSSYEARAQVRGQRFSSRQTAEKTECFFQTLIGS